ncbi:MAG: hypothetical protein ACM3N7_11560, partial [Planctomycetaceae bacterium]
RQGQPNPKGRQGGILFQEFTEKTKEARLRQRSIFCPQEGERRNLHSIELPFLGTKYGSLPKACFLRLLREFLEQNPSLPSLRVWLALPEDTGGDIIDWIEPVLKGQAGADNDQIGPHC